MRRTVAALLVATCANAGAAEGDHNFRVWLGDREIGRHDVTVSRSADETRVVSTVVYNVKVLFVNVYKYEHTAEEVWHGNCLQTISSKTRENGERTIMRGRMSPDGFVVQRNDEEVTEDNSCVGTYAYWDMQRVQRNQLLNTQTGDLDPAEVVPLGRQPLPRLQQSASSYKINTEDSSITLWYSDEGRWLGLQTTANDQPLVYLNENLLP